MLNKDYVEIRWHGRGGQGAKTAALLLADAAFSSGKYVQGFPEYGPERMGAPITAYNRITTERTTVHSNIYDPDYVVVVDETLLDSVHVTAGLKEEGAIIINSEKAPEELRSHLDGYTGKICTIAAGKISTETLGKNFPNTPIRDVAADFAKMTGREYGLIEKYQMDDAEEAIVLIGSSAGTAREAIDALRAQGKKVGMVKIRAFRPFPSEDLVDALKNVKAFAAMDKDDSFNGHCGPIYAELAASLYAAGVSAPKGISYIYGLGGRDVTVDSIGRVFADLEKIAQTGDVGETYRYLDVRE